MIKVVSFDIGGTLVKSNSLEKDNYSFSNLAELVGKEEKTVRHFYKEVFQKEKGSLEELVSSFCSSLDIEVSEDVIKFFKEKFSVKTENVILPEDIDVLKKLKELGYKVILFSNSCCLFENDISKFLDYVDDVFYSYDIGLTKSDSEAYRLVEKRLGVKPNEFLHIGDTLKSDYEKPILNGWNAIYYKDIDDENIESISNLNDIFKVIDKLNKN